jgi:hypothetical protein
MNKHQQKLKEILKPFFEYHNQIMIPATESQLDLFKHNSFKKRVPFSVIQELMDFYQISNGVSLDFNIFPCDEEVIFEWWDEKKLWLGQKDEHTLQWCKNKFCLGDACQVSLSPKYEYPSLVDLIEESLRKWYLR